MMTRYDDFHRSHFGMFVERFSKAYRPEGDDGYRFDADLQTLLGYAYQEAQRPFAQELKIHRDYAIRGSELLAQKPVITPPAKADTPGSPEPRQSVP